jgi:AcrR family transcriptional regulator
MPRREREVQLLDIAEQVFSEKGFQETTVDEIAARAGITKPVIYDHFGSKHALLVASMTRAREELRDHTLRAVQQEVLDGEPEALVRTTIRSFFTFIEGHKAAFRLIQQESAVAAFTEGMEEIRAEQARLVGDLLRTVAPLEGVPDTIVAGYAEVVIGSCERVAAYQAATDELSAEDATEIVMAMLWTGIQRLGR